MKLLTEVKTEKSDFQIEPQTRMLFIGSCFADSIGQCFLKNAFRATVNPGGVMYNPASIFHCVQNIKENDFDLVVITLGTNHIYRLKETGEIVANCKKRPASLFFEEELTVDECIGYLQQTLSLLNTKVIVTVSPIRYAKYGFHGSRLSKATLLLAAERIARNNADCTYFPAYEIMNDELRDYRFHAPDMIHPSAQAIEYIWERFGDTFFSTTTRQYLKEWHPIREALDHRPFSPTSEEYLKFKTQTEIKRQEFLKKWHTA